MILDNFRLDGKTAFVSGAGVGLGQGMAMALAEAGVDVVCHGFPDASETVERIQKMGRKAVSVSANLSEKDAPKRMYDEANAALGKIDILINNAGIIRRTPAVDYSEEDWLAVIELNLNAVWRMCQTFGRGMVERGTGKIINIASLLSFQGGIIVPAYTASKSAVAGLTKALANEWAPNGVNVNAIAPGYMATANTAALRANETRSRQILERIPAGRWGTPEDLGGAAVFLASKAADYVTGHILVVDGGWMAR